MSIYIYCVILLSQALESIWLTVRHSPTVGLTIAVVYYPKAQTLWQTGLYIGVNCYGWIIRKLKSFSHLGWQLCRGNPFAQRGLNAVSKLKHQNGLKVRPTTLRHADSWSSSVDSQTAGICCSKNMTSNDISWTNFKGIQYRSSLRCTECFV